MDDEESISTLILHSNIYTCIALEHIAQQLAGINTVKSYYKTYNLLRALTLYENIKTIIIAYDIGRFNTIDILSSSFPDIKVIVIIPKKSFALVKLLFSLGASKVICEYDRIPGIITALQYDIHQTYISPLIRPDSHFGNLKIKRLTPMEKYVLNRLFTGKTLKEISFEKGISVKTISSHKSSAMNKIKIKKIAELF